MSHFHQKATRVALPPEGDACRTSAKRRPSLMRRGPDEAGNGCAMVARWLHQYPWKHPRRNVKDAVCVTPNGSTPPVKATRHGCSGVPIWRPRRPEHSRSRHQRTAKHLQSAAVHRALPTGPHPESTVGGARTLSTPSDSRPPSSTKRYADAADAGRKRKSERRGRGVSRGCSCRRRCAGARAARRRRRSSPGGRHVLEPGDEHTERAWIRIV
jgi:hypothetical protein